MVNETAQDQETDPSPPSLRWIPILAGAFAVLVAVAAMALLAADRTPGADARAQQLEGLGGDFTLTGHTGAPVSLSDFRGQVVVLYFGFTYCPDVCPIHLTLINAALEELGPRAGRFQPLFVSVDPARDTPAAMAQYVEYFSPDLIGLTGSEAEIGAVASDFAVARNIVGDPQSDTYTVNHSSVIYIIGPEGNVIDLIQPNLTPEALAGQLRRYL